MIVCDFINERYEESMEQVNKNMDEKKRALWVKYVRDMGEHLIKNAESIVGNDEKLETIYIGCHLNDDGYPELNIDHQYRFDMPESIPSVRHKVPLDSQE